MEYLRPQFRRRKSKAEKSRRTERRRLSYAERFVRSRMPYRPAETVQLYASLAGLNGED